MKRRKATIKKRRRKEVNDWIKITDIKGLYGTKCKICGKRLPRAQLIELCPKHLKAIYVKK